MSEQPSGSRISILAVDDDATQRRLLQFQLKTLGYDADFAVNGADALQQWRCGAYKLILTDLHMAVVNGIDLTAAVRRAEAPKKRVPIYLFTSSSSPDELIRAQSAGITGWLMKPVRLPDLEALLHRVLRPGMKSIRVSALSAV